MPIEQDYKPNNIINSKRDKALKIIKILRHATKKMTKPMISTIIDEFGRDPFLILISCLLSLRTRDIISLSVSRKLFSIAKTPKEILSMPISELERIVYPVGFYKNKSKILKNVSKEIIDRFNSNVPSNLDDLLSIKGVGRKTANLVLSEAFNIPAICVDTHVHRLSNHFGLVKTKNPYETEMELQKILPEKYWSEWNKLLVMWGQNMCVPNSTCRCSTIEEIK